MCRSAVLAIAVVLVAGCGQNHARIVDLGGADFAVPDLAPSCPNDLPQSCPANPPSYQNDVAPIIQAYCLQCHSPGGAAADRPFIDYAHVQAQLMMILDQVYACNMPPADAGLHMTEQQRLTLLTWLVCGGPNN